MRQLSTKETQDRLLEMAKAIADILDRQQVRYFMGFGTLLGAVRHHGFIPWDDDFDMHILDEDYSRAMTALRTELPEDLFLEDAESEPLYFHAWAHVKDLHTVAHCDLFPQDNVYEHKGISIDLYRLTPVKDTDIPTFRAKENLRYQRRKYEKSIISEEEYDEQEDTITLQLKDLAAEKQETGKDALADLIKACPLYPEEIFPLKKYRFEDTEFWGPADADAYLTKFYGNYMELPPEDQRHAHYDSVVTTE